LALKKSPAALQSGTVAGILFASQQKRLARQFRATRFCHRRPVVLAVDDGFARRCAAAPGSQCGGETG